MSADVLSKVVLAAIMVVLAIALSRFLPSPVDPEKKRREDLAALAQKMKLRFNPGNDFKIAERFSFLSWLRRGDVRYAYNVFHGNYSEYPVTVFDYHFSTTGGRGSLDYYWSAFVIETKRRFPDLIITHETMESRIAETFDDSRIVFESAEFSSAFRVRSADKKFAFDVCHPQMMEFLLANQDLTIEISGTGVAILFEDWLRPEKIERNLLRLVEIRKLLPEYLFTNA